MYQNQPQAAQVSPGALSAASRATSQFTRSPLVLMAVIAYTCYSAITTIQMLPTLKHIRVCFSIFEISFFLGLAALTLFFFFIASIIITAGLWIMYSHEGKQGANIVNAGINTYLGLYITLIASVALALVFVGGVVGLSMILSELLIPMGYIVFSLVTVAWLRKLVNAVNTSALLKIAHNEGVSTVGKLVMIYLALTLLAYLNVIDTVGSLGAFSVLSDLQLTSVSELASICHMAALLLFGISAFVFNNAMLRARFEDKRRQAEQPSAPEVVHMWQCSCGHVNPDYTTTCICGASKHQAVIDRAAAETQTAPAADHIFCSECGGKCPAQARFCINCGAKIL